MAFCTDNAETASRPRDIIKLDIRTTAGHISSDRDGTCLAGVGYDLGFLFMILGVQDRMRNSLALKKFGHML